MRRRRELLRHRPALEHRGIGVRHAVLEIRRAVAVRVERAIVLRHAHAAAGRRRVNRAKTPSMRAPRSFAARTAALSGADSTLARARDRDRGELRDGGAHQTAAVEQAAEAGLDLVLRLVLGGRRRARFISEYATRSSTEFGDAATAGPIFTIAPL